MSGLTHGWSSAIAPDGSAVTPSNMNAHSGVLEGASGGGLVLLEQHAASSSATLDFTTGISSTYDEYIVDILGLTPASNSSLYLRMGTGAGPTWDSTAAHYSYQGFVWRPGGSALSGTASAAQIVCNYDGGGDLISTGTSYYMVSGRLILTNPNPGTLRPYVQGRLVYFDTSGFRVAHEVVGAYEQSTSITGIQFLMSSGNIASGTIRVYGIAKT